LTHAATTREGRSYARSRWEVWRPVMSIHSGMSVRAAYNPEQYHDVSYNPVRLQPSSRTARFAYNGSRSIRVLRLARARASVGPETPAGDWRQAISGPQPPLHVSTPHSLSRLPAPPLLRSCPRSPIPVPSPSAWHISYPVPPAGLRSTTIRNGDPSVVESWIWGAALGVSAGVIHDSAERGRAYLHDSAKRGDRAGAWSAVVGLRWG
jgi:hypothetical protein